ncbi:MAG TPA: ferritin-like domain-containing protein [Mycobacteriales bacterium]|nr:ferritin-like domain-containing protein [Mycobacteriales bacterium]HWA65410.1 ferritin-like domain-containing protein [Mycobacteriales bacterium]
MTRDLDGLHEESMGQVRDNMAALTERLASVAQAPASRRNFLLGSFAVVGAGALAACGGSSSAGSSAAKGSTSSPSGSSPYSGDLKVVALAAALENLAVAGYGLVLANAGKGVYGKVPPAIAQFATVVQKQHSDHAAAWNGVLRSAGLPQVSGTPLTIAPQAVSALKSAKTLPDVAKVALGLENTAAQTYVFAAANVTDPGGIATAASIAPVEAMHASILSFVLGQYPVPNSDIGITGAVQPSALTA